MSQKQSWQKLCRLIKKEKDFVVACHILPDGDAIGSVLGLGLILQKLKKKFFLSWGNDLYISSHFSFLPGINLLQDPHQCPRQPTVFIALDCGSVDRLGILKNSFNGARYTVNIDHHRDNKNFGQINLVDDKAAACCELIFTLSRKLEIEIDKEIATCLYTGIVTDTGRFQYINVSPTTFRIAAKLLGLGVDPTYIFRNVYENQSFGVVKLLGKALSRARLLSDPGIVYTTITAGDFAATATRAEDIENLIDQLRATKDIEVAVLFKELPDGIRVSLRSTGKIDVGKIAEEYGGGGHPLAAGFHSNLDLETTQKKLFQRIKEETEKDRLI